MALYLNILIALITLSESFKLNFTIKEDQTELNPTSHLNTPLLSFLDFPPLPTRSKTSDRTYVDLCLGTPPQCFSVILQTNSFALWVHDSNSKHATVQSKFERQKSSTLSIDLTQTEVGIYNNSITGFSGLDSLTIGNVIVNKTKFVIATKPDVFTTIDGMLGLGYNPSVFEEEYSLLHQLYNQKIIFHRVYSLKYFNNNTGELSFGNIPEEIKGNFNQYGRCNAIDKIIDGNPFKNKNWQCKLEALTFKNPNDHLWVPLENAKVTFMSYRKRTYVPLKIFEILEREYTKVKLVDHEPCNVKVTKNRRVMQCETIDGLPDLVLLFSLWGMRLHPNQLFSDKSGTSSGNYELLFYYKTGYEKFIMGRRILSQYHMVYDNHNQEIGFYSSNEGNVVLVDPNHKPDPPKIHEEIPDKNPKPKPVEKDPTPRPRRNKTEKKDKYAIEGDNAAGDKDAIRTEKRRFSSAFIMQVVLVIFISLIALGLLGYIVYSYRKYRKKKRFYNQNYYIKQVNELSH